MKDTNIKPSLRISHIVYGRIAVGNKVTYLIAPSGADEKRAIPETVVYLGGVSESFPAMYSQEAD